MTSPRNPLPTPTIPGQLQIEISNSTKYVRMGALFALLSGVGAVLNLAVVGAVVAADWSLLYEVRAIPFLNLDGIVPAEYQGHVFWGTLQGALALIAFHQWESSLGLRAQRAVLAVLAILVVLFCGGLMLVSSTAGLPKYAQALQSGLSQLISLIPGTVQQGAASGPDFKFAQTVGVWLIYTPFLILPLVGAIAMRRCVACFTECVTGIANWRSHNKDLGTLNDTLKPLNNCHAAVAALDNNWDAQIINAGMVHVVTTRLEPLRGLENLVHARSSMAIKPIEQPFQKELFTEVVNREPRPLGIHNHSHGLTIINPDEVREVIAAAKSELTADRIIAAFKEYQRDNAAVSQSVS